MFTKVVNGVHIYIKMNNCKFEFDLNFENKSDIEFYENFLEFIEGGSKKYLKYNFRNNKERIIFKNCINFIEISEKYK